MTKATKTRTQHQAEASIVAMAEVALDLLSQAEADGDTRDQFLTPAANLVRAIRDDSDSGQGAQRGRVMATAAARLLEEANDKISDNPTFAAAEVCWLLAGRLTA